MRALEHIYILIEPRNPGSFADGRPNPTQREFFEFDRFAEELQAHTAARVEIVERWIPDAPRDGILLVAYHIAMNVSLVSMASSLLPNGPRPLLLNLEYGDLQALAEPVCPAGIVLGERFARWRLRQDEAIRRQVYGLKSLASSLGPTLTPNPLLESERYCMYQSREALALPLVLAQYIAVYWQAVIANP